jgi:formylglycine-generating enzyme required for sulfatase activity
VTRGQFRASGVPADAGCHVWNGELWLLDLNRSLDQPGFEQAADHPAVCLSWNTVHRYLDWFNRQPGLAGGGAYRLPSEAEWEYAARAGTATARYWGNEPGEACGWANVADRSARATFPDLPLHDCDDAFAFTAPGGSFKPNPFGLYDLIGNASEWVEDCYAETYPKGIRDGSAFEAEGCPRRVIRGGSWSYSPADARSANRHRYEPDYANNNLGFRLARTL